MKKPNRITIGYNERIVSMQDINRTINMMALLGYYYESRKNEDGVIMIYFTDVPNEAQS